MTYFSTVVRETARWIHRAPKGLIRFLCVGFGGLAVDQSVLFVSERVGTPFAFARAIAILVATFATWALNRRFTFAETGRPAHWEALRYFGVAFVAAPVIAKLTNGKYYLARKPKTDWSGLPLQRCCVCEHSFEPQDVAHCPAYGGTICSLCCSLDARCEDSCKDKAQLRDQVKNFLGHLLPQNVIAVLDSRLGHYMARFILATGLIATVIGLVYFQETLNDDTSYLGLQMPLLKVFLFLTLIARGVAAPEPAAASGSRGPRKNRG